MRKTTSPQMRARVYGSGEPSALRVAALREVLEEVGIAFVRDGGGAVVRLSQEQDRHHARATCERLGSLPMCWRRTDCCSTVPPSFLIRIS